MKTDEELKQIALQALKHGGANGVREGIVSERRAIYDAGRRDALLELLDVAAATQSEH